MVELLIAGDWCPAGRVADLVGRKEGEMIFRSVKPLVESVDFGAVNLECPVVEHAARPIPKCGPNLKTSREAVEWVARAGIGSSTC